MEGHGHCSSLGTPVAWLPLCYLYEGRRPPPLNESSGMVMGMRGNTHLRCSFGTSLPAEQCMQSAAPSLGSSCSVHVQHCLCLLEVSSRDDRGSIVSATTCQGFELAMLCAGVVRACGGAHCPSVCEAFPDTITTAVYASLCWRHHGRRTPPCSHQSPCGFF